MDHPNILSTTALLLLVCAAVAIVQWFIHVARVTRALNHVPGPRPTSILWGEEWLLYSSTPGVPYSSWHEHYGKVVRFRGAFGVSAQVIILSSCMHNISMI